MTMAGKAAEIIKYGPSDVSNGPAGDIQQASGLARAMVLRWGMSDVVGNVDYEQAHEGYMGNGAGGFSVSANTKELIEQEVKRLIDEAYDRAFAILTDKKEEWERLAQGLLEYETLTGEEIERVVRGDPPHMEDDADSGSDAGSAPSVTAIPKTKPKAPPAGDGGLEPEPTT